MKKDGSIPPGAIRMSDAFNFVLRAATPDWQEIYSSIGEPSSAHDERRKSKVTEEEYSAAWERLDSASLNAQRIFRRALEAGELIAWKLDPINGPLQMPQRGWLVENGSMFSTMMDDYFEPDDILNPGPTTKCGDTDVAAYLRHSEFDAWLSSNFTVPTPEQMRWADSTGNAEKDAGDDEGEREENYCTRELLDDCPSKGGPAVVWTLLREKYPDGVVRMEYRSLTRLAKELTRAVGARKELLFKFEVYAFQKFSRNTVLRAFKKATAG